MIFTTESLAALPTTGSRYTVSDSETPGLTVQVLESGYKKLLHVRTVGGRKIRTSLGAVGEASLRAVRARCEALQALSPARVLPASRVALAPLQGPSVTADHIVQFERLHVSKLAASSQALYTSMLGQIAVDFPSLEDIKPRTVRVAMDMRESTPVLANRYLAVLSVFCRFLVERGKMEFNPALGTRRFKEKPKTSSMSDSDLQALAAQLKSSQSNPDVVTAIRTILSTGVRVSEACGMTYSEIGVAAPGNCTEWEIPGSRTKSGRAFITFLPGELTSQLLDQYKRRDARRSSEALVATSTAVRQALTKMCKRAGIDHYSPHDLRRTVGTLLAKAGVPPSTRARFLNHAVAGVTDRHYNCWDYSAEKLEACQIVQTKMRDLGILI